MGDRRGGKVTLGRRNIRLKEYIRARGGEREWDFGTLSPYDP